MKRKPILKPKFQGCLNCSSVPKSIVENDDIIWNYNFMSLILNGKQIDITDKVTVRNFLEEYKIKKEDSVELFYMSAFHDETYELDTEDMKFKLVEQGEGYA